MKLHKNIVQAVIDGLEEIFGKNAYADQIVRKQIKLDRRWGSRDRRFIAETIYDIVRWWRWYLAIGEIVELDSELYLKAVGVYVQDKNIEFPEWFTPEIPDKETIEKNKIKFSNDLKIAASIPDWLNELGNKELAKNWCKEITALNQTTDVVLRVNTLKIEKTKLILLLKKENAEVEEINNFPDALVLKKRLDLSQLKTFRNGFYEVQDASSQLVAPFTQAKSGMTVVDACAGAGGKSLHLAAKMENIGRVISLDTEESKLNELKIRSKRAGCRIIRTHVAHNQQIIKLKESADIVLIDAPCSGLGVLRRKPDFKWKLNPERIEELKELQKQILDVYKNMVKPGGSLVYVTCSILPSENEKQVEHFLSKNEGKYSLEEERKVMPSEGFDGFYLARLRNLEV